MKVAVFYFSETWQEDASVFFLPTGRVVFIRAQEIEAADCGDALDAASPRVGESVMNTHELGVSGAKS